MFLLANNIGNETCTETDSSVATLYKINYNYNDRGIKHRLITNYAADINNKPLYFYCNGFTSRWESENISISNFNTYNISSFPVAKFAPATMQQLLIQYWRQQHQPLTIHALPYDSLLHITDEGYDSLHIQNTVLVLLRIKITGLIWGNEFAWTDSSGALIFLSTNDTEGDKIEIINNDYKAAFDELLALSNHYAIDAVSKEFPAGTLYNDIAITGGTLINVSGKDSITQNALVIIHNGKITYAGKMDTARILPDDFIIHAENKFLLPGLWDMHAHLMQAEWLPKYIQQGVTTVRDCGNEFDFINALQAASNNNIVGPQIIKAGLIDGNSSNALGNMKAGNKKEALNLIHKYLDNGFLQIKIYSSIKLPVLKSICDEAHLQGLTVTGHVPDGISATTAINSGMDMISHISFFRNSILTSGNSLDMHDKRTAEFVQLLLNKKIVLDPTLSVYETADSSYIKNISFYKIATYNLMKAGVPVVAGTDMSNGGVPHELELYVESGFSPLQALQAATIIPAKVMSMDKENGSIEAGKNADILILNSNPLNDIKNLHTLTTIIHQNHIADCYVLP